MTTVLDSALLHQDIRGKDDLLRAFKSSTNLANTQIILMKFLNYPLVSIIVPNFSDEGTEDQKVY